MQATIPSELPPNNGWTQVQADNNAGPCLFCRDDIAAMSLVARLTCCSTQVLHVQCMQDHQKVSDKCPLCSKQITVLINSGQGVHDDEKAVYDLHLTELQVTLASQIANVTAGTLAMNVFVRNFMNSAHGLADDIRRNLFNQLMDEIRNQFAPDRHHTLESEIETAFTTFFAERAILRQNRRRRPCQRTALLTVIAAVGVVAAYLFNFSGVNHG